MTQGTDHPKAGTRTSLEEGIAEWRAYLRRRQAIHSVDADELEDHLRSQASTLVEAGLTEDEAFLIAVKRIGDLDALSREFAREHSERLWKRLVVAPGDGGDDASGGKGALKEALVAVALATAAAVAIKVPELFGVRLHKDQELPAFYLRNFSLFVLPFLAAFFAWKRSLAPVGRLWLAAPFVVAAVVVNLMPFVSGGSTEVLAALHLPIALWLVVGGAYAGGRWRDHDPRMNYVRFSGEWFIYYALIAFGGGVLMALTLFIFGAIGLNAQALLATWVLPCGAVGAVVDRGVARGGQAERHREHGAGADAPLHAALHRDAAGVPGDHGVDRQRHRRRAARCSSASTCCWRWWRAWSSTPSPPGTRRSRRASSTPCSSSSSSAPWSSTPSRCGPSPPASPSSASAPTRSRPWARTSSCW